MEILLYWIIKAICILLPALYYYHHAKQEQNPKPQSSPAKQARYSQTYLTNPRNRQLQAQLLEILEGDVSTAKQLLQQQRRMFPDRHDNWYLAKVIHNLKHGKDELKDYEAYFRLVTILQGDDAAADRLLLQQRNAYPGKQYGWYLEKVIYDLERDRR
ncbi:MAG: hypothetical protein V7K47_16725 [Nostoc sp.]